ncbi:hypothetical protein Tco_0861945 [Tanacetum coccineum]
MAEGLSASMLIERMDAQGKSVFTSRAWRRLFDIRGMLVHELILEFFSTFRFGEAILDLDTPGALQFQLGRARRRLSWRQFILALGLHTDEEMQTIRFRAHISGGQFVARLAKHFRLLTVEILYGLTIIAPELPIIDMAELVRLQICMEIDDTWAWVAMRPERLGRLKEEVQGLHRDVKSLRGLVERSITNQGRFSTWMFSCIAQLMEASGQAYQAFDGTFRGSSPAAFQRCTRQRTNDASTSTVQQDQQQPDP